MNWTIRVTPTTTALDDWSWVALRDDKETVFDGVGYATSTEAQAEARAVAQEFENNQGIIKDNSFTEVFEPVVPE
jgi:hypothetical protein